MANRDDFSEKTKDRIGKRVGFHCSEPTCNKYTIGPEQEGVGIVNIGVAAHITAAAPGGPRYDADLTSEQRKSYENGIWLCQTHAKLIDDDARKYTSEVLKEWRESAERRAADRVGKSPSLETITGGTWITPQNSEQFVSRTIEDRKSLWSSADDVECKEQEGWSVYLHKKEDGQYGPVKMKDSTVPGGYHILMVKN
jgi:hypothetical protein